MATTSALANFALAAAGKVADGHTTAYTYTYSADGSVTQPSATLPGSDGVPMIALSGPAGAYSFADCSGWVSFALDAVAPVHQAVAAAARTLDRFNLGAIPTADNQAVLMNEATQWGWARADVLAHLFDTATGQNGFTKVSSFADLQPGDLIAYALGIYTDPKGNVTTNPGLVSTLDTGHTMVVVKTPHEVMSPDALDGSHNESPDVVKVYAISVVDSSTLMHFTIPEPDDRNYEIPAGTPAWLAAQQGGLGTGTIWFGVNAAGKAIQFRFDLGDDWEPTPAGASTEKALITAARLTDTVDLSSAHLDHGTLLVRVYPNASPTIDGTSYTVPEVITGTGNLLVSGGGTLSLGTGNSFTGQTEVAGGTTLAMAADDSLGGSGNHLVLDDGATLRLGAAMELSHATTLQGGATLDLSGNLVRLTKTLSGTGTSVLTLSSSTAGGELKLNSDLTGIGGIQVQGGAALTLTSNGGVPGMVQLQAGATLNVHASASLTSLAVSGAATLDLEGGATLTLVNDITPVAGAAAFGTLTVTGTGSLLLEANGAVKATVTPGQTVFTGTLAQFSGHTLTGYKLGDLIDVSDLLPTKGPNGQTVGVTATYDNVAGTLTVTRGDQSGVLTLTPGLVTPDSYGNHQEFTIRPDGTGGTLVDMAKATGNEDSVALHATRARAASGLDGSGITVGVISSSFNTTGGMAQDTVNGYLPTDTVILSEAPTTNTDEGRSMARIIHNIAPGAAIRFAYASGNTTGAVEPGADLATAIRKLVDGGAKVIVDDVTVFGDRVYQEGGVVADAIAYAYSKNVTLVTAASNSGENYYEHAFTLTQTNSQPDAPGAYAYDFNLGQGAKNYFQEIDLPSSTPSSITVTLAWDQPAQNPAYTLTLKVYTYDGTSHHLASNVSAPAPYALDASVRTITISDVSPGEKYYFAVTSDADVSGTFKYIIHDEGHSQLIQDPAANTGTGAIFGHALDPHEITVGAVDWRTTPAYGHTPVNETFSAPGTGEYRLDASGAPIANPVSLGKPDVSGVDGTADDKNGTSGLFYGTSAAAPSVAGVAALILAANNALTPDQVKAVLKASAFAMPDTTVAGAGLVQADKALELARVPAITAITATPDRAGVPLNAGHTVTLTLAASVALVVTAAADGALPSLVLDDGGTALFDAAASTGTSLVFRTVVAAGQDTRDLTVLRLSLNGATVANAAQLALTTEPLSAVPGAVTGLVIDTTTPAVTIALDPSSPAGVIAGTTEPGARLTLSAATGPLGTVQAGSDGRWSFPLTGLPNGSNMVTATVTDAAGNTGSAQLPVTVTNGSTGSTRVATAGETLTAGSGPDTLVAGGAGVHLVGGPGPVQLVGAISGASTLTGGTGGTVFVSRGGATRIEGGGGHDTIHAAAGDVTVVGGTGGGLIGLGAGTALVNGQGPDTIIGGAGAATIGSAVNSLVSLGTGTALVSAGSGSTVVGGGGSGLVGVRGTGVTFFGGSGRAVFIGGTGDSQVVGGTGSSTVFGGQGGGVFAGGAGGHNVMVGGQGATTLFGGGDGDVLFATGSAGTTLVAGRGNETLQGAGSSGNDVFFAGAGTTLIGLGSGQDTVFAGSGAATVVGGAGTETFAVVKGQAGGSLGIFGFKAGTDHVSLSGFGANEAAQALAGATVEAGSTTITLSDNTRISFLGVQGLDARSFA